MNDGWSTFGKIIFGVILGLLLGVSLAARRNVTAKEILENVTAPVKRALCTDGSPAMIPAPTPAAQSQAPQPQQPFARKETAPPVIPDSAIVTLPENKSLEP